METLIAWMVAVMLAAAPHYTSHTPEAVETPAEMQERYTEIARDIATVVYDPEETPLFQGARGRERSAATVLSIAFFESSFRKAVDKNIGKEARGDHGRSWCLMQLNIGNGKTVDGWTGPELIEDRTKCIRSAYRYIKMSFGSCRGMPFEDRLSAYASGKCFTPSTVSRRRLSVGSMWFSKSPSVNDEIVISELYPQQETEKQVLLDDVGPISKRFTLPIIFIQ